LTLWLLKASGEPWLWSIRPDELPAFLEETGWSCSDPDQHGENQGQGIEYYRVAFKSGHSGAGSNQPMEPDPGTSSLDPAV
jgi:hypothetical protein